MTTKEYCDELYKLKFMCGFNQQYHQILEWRYGVADKLVKVALAIFTLIGVVLAFPSLASPTAGVVVAVAAAAAAWTLNIIPLDSREKFHGEMFRLWSDLHADAEQEGRRSCGRDISNSANHHFCDRLGDLQSKAHALHAMEPAAHRGLLQRCEEDERERMWGPGVRTVPQVEEARQQQATSL